jgi:serine protein kinase
MIRTSNTTDSAPPSTDHPPGEGFNAQRFLESMAEKTRSEFANNRSVMSFAEYLALFTGDPVAQSRSAGGFLRDMFDHYGHVEVASARGIVRRFKLFDCPFDEGRDALLGQEEVQESVYRMISNFATEGYTDRVILLHGPNGSAKSTLIGCIQRAMEHFCTLPEGALYRFNWVFPSAKLVKGGIGFGERTESETGDSYAHLEEELIEGRFSDEFRDHPLLLLPAEHRRTLLEQTRKGHETRGARPSRSLLQGGLSPRNRMIFEALLNSYRGDLARVLRHVQVERFYISRRYREGVATVGPQLAVDASARQLTVGRNLGGLPPAIQALPLHEYSGELVDGNRGMVEFEDLLKRPLDAFKYLLTTVEDGQVALDMATLNIDTVFIASSNETYLSAFKEIPEFQSFKGRMELVRAPYLLDIRLETAIYEDHIRRAMPSAGGQHIAPHVAWVAGHWAVLTRMRKPMAEKYPKPAADLVGRLGPLDKALLYSGEDPVEKFSADELRDLRATLERLARESDSYPNYEGRIGASPREMKLLLMNAAQNRKYNCVSPFAVLEELEELVKNVSVFEFLKQEPVSGGYHEHRKFIFQVRERLLDRVDEEVRVSMGLVDEGRYLEQFTRYVTQVSYWTKGEKFPNPITGKEEPPNEDMMSEIERILEVGSGKREEFRRDVIARIGAWSIDHRGMRPIFEEIFPRQIEKLKESFYGDHKKRIGKRNESMLRYLSGEAENLETDDRKECESTLKNLRDRFGYCDRCARDSIVMLVRKRYAD